MKRSLLLLLLVFFLVSSVSAATATWDNATKTYTIKQGTNVLGTVRQISIEPDLITFTEIIELNSTSNRTLTPSENFIARYNRVLGKYDISFQEVYHQINESFEYHVYNWSLTNCTNTTLPEIECNISATRHFGGKCDLFNETTCECSSCEEIDLGYNTTGYRLVWENITGQSTSLIAGTPENFKLIYYKKPEIGSTSIQIIPKFFNIEMPELTWWDTDWTKRADITLSGACAAGLQVKGNVTYDSDMQADFDDLRFVDGDDTTALDYWIEVKSDSNFAIVWVECADTGTDIIMYYDHDDAPATSNCGNTMIFCDEFTSDITGWTIWAGSATLGGGSGTLTHYEDSGASSSRPSSTTYDDLVIFGRWQINNIQTENKGGLIAHGAVSTGEGDFYRVVFLPTVVNIDTRYGGGTAWATIVTYSRSHSSDTYYRYGMKILGNDFSLLDSDDSVLGTVSDTKLPDAGYIGTDLYKGGTGTTQLTAD